MAELRKWKENIWFIVLIAGVASVPLFTDYVPQGSSLAATLGQIEVMGQGLGKMFPVRIDILGSAEQGYSVNTFGANVFYLFPALLHLAGMGLVNAYKAALLFFHFATAAIAFFCFERCGGRREIGLIGSLLYTWCPYRCSEMYLAGDLGTVAAWAFLPIVLLGLKLLYTEDREQEKYGRLWVALAGGMTLVALSSLTFFAITVLMTVFVLLAMGKETLRRRTVVVLGKTFLAVLLLNAWFLGPALLYLKDPAVTGLLLVRDMRSMGLFPTQYLTIFPKGGDSIRMWENGMRNVQAVGPGIAVILLAIVYLGVLFTGSLRKSEISADKDKNWRFAGRMMGVSAVLVFLSTNLFPWDLFENRNLLFSIGLALLQTPAKLGAVADIGLILIGCLLLQRLSEYMGEKEYRLLLLAVIAAAFGTTQFLLGDIMVTRQFVRQEEIAAAGTLPFSLLAQEPLIWRVMEGISIVALCACAIMQFVRRHDGERKV